MFSLNHHHGGVDDGHEVIYGDGEHSKMYVGDDHEVMHIDDAPCRAVMMAHLHVHLCHGAFLSSKKSVDEDPSPAVRMVHVPWHLCLGALLKMKSVGDNPHVALGDDDHA